jgi:Fe-S cluster assembly protein SufD
MTKELTKDDFLALAQQGEGLVSSENIQKEALVVFQNKQLPTLKTEEWKYTNIRQVLQKEYTLPLAADEADFKLPNLDAYFVVLMNGRFSAKLSNFSANGLVVLPMNEAKMAYPAIFEKYYNKTEVTEASAFSALNSATAENGVFIYLKKSKELDKPLVFITVSENSDKAQFIQTRNLIVVEENAGADILACFTAKDCQGTAENAVLSNIVTEVVVENDARLEMTLVEADNKANYQFNHLFINQAQSSTFSCNTFTLSGAIIRNELKVTHQGEYCTTNLNGLYLPQEKQHFDNYTFIHHAKANSDSNQLYKGIGRDTGSAVFFGKVYVEKNAQKTSAYQSNRNILLSNEAKITSRPQLEIYADDVKCSHGSSTGRLDENAIFYMQARCIGRETAKHLLLQAFADEVCNKIKNQAIRELVLGKVAEKLEK